MTHSPPGGTAPIELDPRVRDATKTVAILGPLLLTLLSIGASAVLLVLIGSMITALVQVTVTSQTVTVPPWHWGAAAVLIAVIAGSQAGATRWVGQAKATTERELRILGLRAVIQSGSLRAGADRTGRILAVLSDGIAKISNYQAGFLGPIAGSLLGPLVVLLVIGVAISWKIALILVVMIPLIPLIVGAFQRGVRQVSAQYRRSQGQLSAAFQDAIGGLSTISYLRATGRVGADLAERSEESRARVMKLLAGNQLIILVVDLVFSWAMIAVAAALALQGLRSGELLVGQAFAVIACALLLVGPVDTIGQFFYIGMVGRAAARQFSGLLVGSARATAPDSPSGTGTHAMVRVGGDRAQRTVTAPDGQDRTWAIQLESVTASYPALRGGPASPPAESKAVLQDFTLRIRPGEHIGLVGPSGVGKSTVVSLLMGRLTPRGGKVLINGQPPEAARGQVAIVDQQAFLFAGTIADNLRVARPDATTEQMWEALHQAQLRREVESLPDQLESQVGEQGQFLSGGQAQRLAIARALLQGASILIFDEPTSQVDLRSERLIMQAIESLRDHHTIVTVAHRQAAIAAADTVIDMGRLASLKGGQE